MDAIRTPDEVLQGLPDFPYEPHYRQVDELRLAHIDEGDGPPVVMFHGEPTWSFLWRKVLPPVRDAGYRVICPDQVGFGRSDKPTERDDFSYARHVEWVRALVLDELALEEITFFGQDWGGLIGLRLVAEHPDRFARVAIGNTGLPTGHEPMSEAFLAWQQFSQTTPDFDLGAIISMGVVTMPPPEVVAAYNAPFPDDSYKAGARIFPTLVPTSPDDPASEANVAARKVLAAWEKPFLTLFSDSDPITGGAEHWFQENVPGAAGQPHTTIAGGGHFLQEDQGPLLGAAIADWLAA